MHTLLVNLNAGTGSYPDFVPSRDVYTNKVRTFQNSAEADAAGLAWAADHDYSPHDYRVESGFEIGDGCTWTIATDQVSCTVVAVSKTGHRVEVTRDRAECVARDFTGERQEYEFTTDPDGPRMVFTRRKLTNGTSVFKMTGSRTRSQGMYLSHGRSEYRDPSF